MNSLRRMLLICGCILLAGASGVLCSVADETDEKQKTKTSSSLDQQLLDDLDNALLEGLDDKPAEDKSNAGGTSGKKSGQSPLDEELLRDLGGEDIGRSTAAQDPLVPIGRQMRSVQTRLSEQKLDDQTRQLQKNILGDLSALLQECKKQCQGGASGKPGSKSGKSGTSSQAGNSPATDAARDSSQNLRDRQTQRGETGALVNAMKESWGNLPEHARKHLSNVNPDAFLPKYELMLEKYFKRLGEAAAHERFLPAE